MRYFCSVIKPALLVILVALVPVFHTQSAAQSDPCLEVAPDTLEFYLPLYAETLILDTQAVIVHNCGDGDLEWTGYADQSWVGFTPNSGGNFDSVAVWIVVSGLPDIFTPPPPGDTLMLYATLTFEAPGAQNSPQTVGIKLGLYQIGSEDCYILVEPHWIEHHLSPGNTITDSFFVTEAEGKDVTISLFNDSDWLTLPVFFAVPRTPTTIPFWINADGLAPGIYYDTIEVVGWLHDEYAVNCGTRHIPVVLYVDSVGFDLLATPSSFEYHLQQGDTIIGDSLYIEEISGHEINFWTSNSASWLEVDTMAASPLYTPRLIFLNVFPGSLPSGMYIDTVWIDAAEIAQPLAVPVFLFIEGDGSEYEVKTMPTYIHNWLEPDETFFDSLRVYEVFDRSVHFVFYNTQPWLTVEPLGWSGPYVTPRTLLLQFDASSMSVGDYIDTVFIIPDTSEINSFAPVAVPVAMTVVDQSASIIVTPDHFEFWMDPGDTLHTGLLVYEQSGDSVPFGVELAGSSGWLNLQAADSSGHVTPDSVRFHIITAGLDPGLYRDTIIIFNPLDCDCPYFEIRIPVLLTVSGDPADIVLAADPAAFHLQLLPDDSRIDSLHIYEIYGRTVGFVPSAGASWITIDPFFPMPPYETPYTLPVMFTAESLAPGVYIDSIFISAHPHEDSLSFAPIAVPVTMTVTADTSENIVIAEPASFEFIMNSFAPVFDTLHVSEIHGYNVEFMHHHKSIWLTVNPLEMPPLMTPATMPIAVNPDTLPLGHYVDTIVIYPGYGGPYFPPVAVPVDLYLMDGPFFRGDANFDSDVNVGDAVYILNYIFRGGPPPEPHEAGDSNCDGTVNVGDAVYLINFVFRAGPEPMSSCQE